jgi:hypothetical protein
MRFFAEKAQPEAVIRQAAMMMFGAVREIVLIRDPRDLVCSYNAFWQTEMSEARETVLSQLRPIMALWEQRLPSTFFVKYEDLATDPRQVMSGVFSFLGLDPAPPAVEDQHIFKRHGTSPNRQASIGRWRLGLQAPEVAACTRDFSTVLSTFDYRE